MGFFVLRRVLSAHIFVWIWVRFTQPASDVFCGFYEGYGLLIFSCFVFGPGLSFSDILLHSSVRVTIPFCIFISGYLGWR
jgi:hypothetical protein